MDKLKLTKKRTKDGLWYRKGMNEHEKAVFFLHGLGDTPDHFFPVAKMMDKLSYSPVLIDFPGHGINQSAKGDFGRCLSYLNDVFELEGNGSSVVVGHSLGGLIGLVWAARRESSSTPKLVMIEPSITQGDYDFFNLIQEPPAGIGVAVLAGVDPENNHPYHRTYSANVAMADLETLKRLTLDVYEHFAIYQQEVMAARVPFLYVYGKASSSPELREKMRSWPGVEVLAFEGAEHWVHLDNNFFTSEFVQQLANS